MYKINVNNGETHEVKNAQGDLLLNNSLTSWEITPINNHRFLAIKNNRVYNIDVLSFERKSKKAELLINGRSYKLTIHDRLSVLLDEMGIDVSETSAIKEINAPMPGLIHDVMVTLHQEVKKGDSLLILEAMKMENIIKSPTDGTVSKILIKKGESVEKNQLLIQF